MSANPFNPEPLEKFAEILTRAPWYSRLARYFVAYAAKFNGRGYGLVPMAWSDWALKSATCEEYLAKMSPPGSFSAGFHSGKAETYRRISAEIKVLQESVKK